MAVFSISQGTTNFETIKGFAGQSRRDGKSQGPPDFCFVPGYLFILALDQVGESGQDHGPDTPAEQRADPSPDSRKPC